MKSNHYSRRDAIKFGTLGSMGILLNAGLISCVDPTAKKTTKTANKFELVSDKVELISNPLNSQIGIFKGKGGTIGVFADKEGIVVIDSQFPDTVTPLVEDLKKSEINLKALINTHHHGDHTAGNIVFKDYADKIISHVNSRKNQEKAAIKRDNLDAQHYPTTLFDENYILEIGTERINCTYHGAAHTNGDIITHFENANVVHMGDLIFNRRFPYIDKSAGANIENWINVLDFTGKHFDQKTAFIFGHAADGYEVTGTQNDIIAFKTYLSNLLSFMEKEVKAGKSLEEIKNNTKTIPGSEEWTGKGIERSLDAAFQEISES